MYKKVREQYKTSAQENLRIGSLKPLEELLPSERKETVDTRAKRYKPASNLTQQEVSLAKQDCEAIDKLFKGFDEKPNSTAVETSEGKSRRKEQFKKGNEQIEKLKISA